MTGLRRSCASSRKTARPPDLHRAGMIGLTGCNDDGLAVVVNNLDMLPASPTGLPVAFVLRGILERRTLAAAVDFVSQVPHATGQHYGIAAPEGLASVEGWATGVAVSPELERDSCTRIIRSIRTRRLGTRSRAISGAGRGSGRTTSSARLGRAATSSECRSSSPTAPFPSVSAPSGRR